MELQLDLTISSNIEQVESWISQYTPQDINDLLMIKDDIPGLGKYINMGNPVIPFYEENKYIKILGKPYCSKNHVFVIKVGIGVLSDLNTSMDGLLEIGIGDETLIEIPFLTLIGITDNKTKVIFRLKNIDLYQYFKDISTEIARVWPEAKREIFSTFNPIEYIEMPDVLFDYILTIQPLVFFDWIGNELTRKYPGYISREFNDCQVLTYVSWELFWPDEENPFWQFIIFATDIQYKPDDDGEIKPEEIFDGGIVRIELRQLNNNRYHLSCFSGTQHPVILNWLSQLSDSINIFFKPGIYFTI